MNPREFIRVMQNWRSFLTADKPVIGATEAELKAIGVPMVIIPGDDIGEDGGSTNDGDGSVETPTPGILALLAAVGLKLWYNPPNSAKQPEALYGR